MGEDRLLKRLLRERFIVTLRNGEAFDGLLVEVDARTIRLAQADAITKTSRVSVDGDLYLPRAEVTYLQRPRPNGALL